MLTLLGRGAQMATAEQAQAAINSFHDTEHPELAVRGKRCSVKVAEPAKRDVQARGRGGTGGGRDGSGGGAPEPAAADQATMTVPHNAPAAPAASAAAAASPGHRGSLMCAERPMWSAYLHARSRDVAAGREKFPVIALGWQIEDRNYRW
eukprot:COSAG06_NODE_32581_length_503_cov_1.945545_1_plen_149_part_01